MEGSYISHNTRLLDVNCTLEKILTTDYVKEIIFVVEKLLVKIGGRTMANDILRRL